MKFYHYINEQQGSREQAYSPRTKSITEEQFHQLSEKNCSNFINNGNEIFRGVKFNNEYGYINPTQHIRKSANTDNYYTILVDEILPSWKNMPKRSKSVICSTDLSGSSSYGNVYKIYPYNGSKIGVCPEDDFWYSFVKSFDYDMHDFNFTLKIISKTLLTHDLKETKQSLITMFKKIDNHKYIYDNAKKENDTYMLYLLSLHKKSNKPFQDFLDDLLNPNKNGFRLYNTSNYKHHENKEVFIEGECLLENIR